MHGPAAMVRMASLGLATMHTSCCRRTWEATKCFSSLLSWCRLERGKQLAWQSTGQSGAGAAGITASWGTATAAGTLFGGSSAVMVAYGGVHMLVLTAVGLVWSCGRGADGRLGHSDMADQLLLTPVAAFLCERFGVAQIVMVAAGGCHSVALGAEGRM